MTKIVKEHSVASLDALLEITAYDQMHSRALFRTEIDSDVVKPIEIIGFYPALTDEIQCGRSGCRRRQKKGYLVVCDDGSETNIGEECGENILGVSWAEITSGFANRWAQKMTLEKVRAAVANAKANAARLQTLIDQPVGVKWLIQTMKLFAEQTPRELTSALNVRANRSEDKVIAPRRRSDAELALYDAAHAPPDSADEYIIKRYEASEARCSITELVGRFVGLEVFRIDGRSLVFQELKPRLDQLLNVDANALSWKERREWEIWLRELEVRFKQVEAWLGHGVGFFGTPANFALLGHVPLDASVRREIEGQTWGFPDGGWRRLRRAA